MQDKIIIIGYSGHAYVVVESAQKIGIDVKYYCAISPVKYNPFNFSYLGNEMDSKFEYWGESNKYILGIGDNFVRVKIANQLKKNGQEILNVIDPDTFISQYAEIGIGNYIAKSVSLNAFAKIGNYCILNTGSIIEHNCQIFDGVHIAPGAVLAGNVSVGANSFIGANSVIKQGISIGENVVIGAGSVVIENVSSNCTVVGNPSRIIKNDK